MVTLKVFAVPSSPSTSYQYYLNPLSNETRAIYVLSMSAKNSASDMIKRPESGS
jgi:hypothetical protein